MTNYTYTEDIDEDVYEEQLTELSANLYSQVVETRRLTPGHPMTPPLDGSKFAFCELAEVDDALLRLNPRYIRNNQKDIDVAAEIGDTFYMISSTIMAINEGVEGDELSEAEETLAMVGYRIAMARWCITEHENNSGKFHMNIAQEELIRYCHLTGIDPQEALNKTKEKFLRKFGEKKE